MAAQPKVLRVITRMNIGGPARQAISLTKGLRLHFATTLVAGHVSGREGELSDPEVVVTRVPLTRPVSPLMDARSFIELRALMARQQFAIVHTHMAKAGTVGRAASQTFWGQQRPITIHTFHGHVLEGYFGGAQQRAFIEIERRLAKRTDILIAVSPEVRDELLDLGIGRARQFEVVPLGFDLSKLATLGPRSSDGGGLRRHLGVAAGAFLVGVIGRLVPIKDHATLFEAFAQVPGAELAVLGDGELRHELEGMAAALGISERVHFAGWWLDIPAAMADLDMVVLTSRNEGTPVALIEALAAGRPVVATDVGGVKHVVQDGETGWLCPAGNPSALAAKLRAAAADPGALVPMALEGRARVTERFRLERLIADHAALYSSALAER